MTKGDLIYCYTCGKISFDTSPAPDFRNPNTKPSKSRQDSRYNPNWNYRCGNCHGFKTINASQFLERQKAEAKEKKNMRGRKTHDYYERKKLEKQILSSIKHIPYNK